ncbi:MAG: hypothetical protein MSH60_02085 [Ruminococcus sp.]|nr:hypothetical protein [Ruminococcus sp.]
MTINNLFGSDPLINRSKRNTTKLQKSIEKLASGYRINNAADDAAGLAMSEKMRTIIAGLQQGVKNIDDGISYLHSQDGSAQEIHNILHRLEQLAVQAANGTYTDVDRDAIDCEYQQLIDEIGHITDTHNFNELPLFEKHMKSYGLNEGTVVHDKPIEISGSNTPAVIGYTIDGKQQEFTIDIPYGTYDAGELADMIDTILFEKAPNLIIGLNEQNQFTMQTEPGRLDYIGGPGASLFYDSTIGSADGHLLGVTMFTTDQARLEIVSGGNDVMSFRLGEDDTVHSITLDPGRYTRLELVDHINSKLEASGIPGNVHAVAETNKEGGKIIGLASTETITGLTGNFLKMDNMTSPIYDIANYGYTDNKASVLSGKKIILSNTEIVRGRNDYFTLDLKWYADDGSQDSRRVTVKLLDDGENEKVYGSPTDITARINEQLDGLPFTAEINPSGCIEIKSEQFGDKCSVDLVESAAPSKYMVYDLFDSGTLTKLNPSVTTSRFQAAYLTSKKELDTSIVIPPDENELVFNITADGGNKKLNITIPAGTYGASALEAVLNNEIAASAPDLAGKLEFTVGKNITLSAVKYDGADISGITASSSASGYDRLIGGVYYSNSYSITNGSEKTYITETGTMPSGKPAATATAGSSVNVVSYRDDTSSTYQQQGSYLNYNKAAVTFENGKEVFTDPSESIVGDERTDTYPAKMTMKDVLTQFSAAGTSLRDINLAFSLKDKSGSKSFNITVPKGSTASQAIAAINSSLDGRATARANGNSLIITTTAEGDGVTITPAVCDMAYTASKSSLASNSDAVIDMEHNRVYIPSKLTIPKANTQIPLTVDSANDKFIFTAGQTNYNLTLTHKEYSSISEIASELNRLISEKDGGTPKTSVTVSGNALVFKGSYAESGNITVSPSSTCNIHMTKVVASTAGNPNYNPATGKIENPATLTAAGFSSHFPMAVTSANNTVTFRYTSPANGTKNVTLIIPDGTYSTPAEAAQKISDAINADPDLRDEISVSYSSNGLTFKTQKGGDGYSLTDLGGTANIDKYISKANVGSGGSVDPTINKVLYPAKITNSNFGTLFSGKGLNIASSNKHVALVVGGNTVEFDLTEGNYSGTSGMNDILSQLQNGFSGQGITVSLNGSQLVMTTDDKGNSALISMSPANTSPVFKRAVPVSKESTVERTDSRCTIIGRTNIGSITISDYDNKMSFDYATTVAGNPVSGKADISVPPGAYTANTLAAALQSSIDNLLGANELQVFVSGGRIGIKGATPSDSRSISNFSGRLFDNAFQDARYSGITAHTETPGTTMGSKLSYIIGRNSLEPETAEELESKKNVVIYTGLNDTVIFDLNYDGDISKIEFTIPAGDYDRKELADIIEEKGREQFARLTDKNGKPFPADFFNVSVGLSELGVPENNTGISSSDKLVFWCKLPDDGRNEQITAIVDGVRGNAAYRIFYDATKSPQPSIFMGKPDLSDGIVIDDSNNIFGFELDNVPYSVEIPRGEYTLDELADTLNRSFEDMGSIVRTGHRNGHLMFYTSKNGDYIFNKFFGTAADDLVYGGVDREDDDEIGIHTGRRTDSYIIYEKTRLDEHLMRINTTGVTTVERALKAIERLAYAEDYLSRARAVSGANENRSLHSRTNSEVYIENLTASESRIRDADIPKQYAEYTKHQLLGQTNREMVARLKENQSSVLNLLA